MDVAAAHGQTLVHDGLERQFLAAAHLVVGGDHGHGAGVDDALLQRLGREAAEHHGVGGANARAGLHGHHTLDGHGHVDQDAVALLDALGLERVGKLAHPRQQFLVRDLGHGAVVGLEDDGSLVLDRRAHVLVQAVGRGVEFAVIEPLVERLLGLVQRAGKGLGPDQVLTRQPRPGPLEILVKGLAHGLVLRHAGDARRLDDCICGGKYTVLDQNGFDGGRR